MNAVDVSSLTFFTLPAVSDHEARLTFFVPTPTFAELESVRVPPFT
jgi:hypothetical protein